MATMDMAETIVIDCDGVLTDGKLYIDHSGEKMFKAFHSRDVRALRELVANGYRVIIVTADDWNGSEAFAEKCGVEFMVTRDKSNLPFEYNYAVGDDAWDVAMLRKAKVQAFAPFDSDRSVKANVQNIRHFTKKGGEGLIAELVNILLQ